MPHLQSLTISAARDEFEHALLVFFFFLVWVSRWFVCLDLSFWLSLDLIVASVGYVVEDQLGLCV